ncbi:hypothetical protein MMPV_001241 [Pyropia vietnamensis]
MFPSPPPAKVALLAAGVATSYATLRFRAAAVSSALGPLLSSPTHDEAAGTARTAAAAAAATAAGVCTAAAAPPPPPRVGILAPPTTAFAAALTAVWSPTTAAAVVPLAAAAAPREVAATTTDAEVAAVVTSVGLAAVAREAGLGEGGGVPLVLVDDVTGEVVGVEGGPEVRRGEVDPGPASPASFERELHCRPLGVADPCASAAENGAALSDTTMAALLYTSGTTGAPKGAIWSRSMVAYQVSTLHTAWAWRPDDVLLSYLPTHHVHGLVNAFACGLAAGATVDHGGRWSAAAFWDRIIATAAGDAPAVTVFMGVPTMYRRALAAYTDDWPRARRTDAAAGVRRLRLAVCGSAPLPPAVRSAWAAAFRTPIVERYGMTETGMAVSQSRDGTPVGWVGYPLPGVDATVCVPGAEEHTPATPANSTAWGAAPAAAAGSGGGDGVADGDVVGELRLRGPGVLTAYWQRPSATAAAFDSAGYFRTGDVVRRRLADGAVAILGRLSRDVVKVGGHKVSALEVEGVLGDCPGVAEVAVVGVPDADRGEVLAAAVVVGGGGVAAVAPVATATTNPQMEGRRAPDAPNAAAIGGDGGGSGDAAATDAAAAAAVVRLRAWAATQLEPPKVPRVVRFVGALPTNTLGKVLKAEVAAALATSQPEGGGG